MLRAWSCYTHLAASHGSKPWAVRRVSVLLSKGGGCAHSSSIQRRREAFLTYFVLFLEIEKKQIECMRVRVHAYVPPPLHCICIFFFLTSSCLHLAYAQTW